MSAPRRPVLPPPLEAKLAALSGRLGQSDRELEEVLTGLAALPANQIVRASFEIANAARFGWWKPPPSPPPKRSWWSFRKPTSGRPMSEPDILAKNPNYAWLFLFHTNGYLREAALDTINAPPTSPFFFSALAWRLNDWAAPVRQAAIRCANRILHRTTAEVAANAALFLLDRRFAWGRWRDEPKILDAVFARKEVIAALVPHLAARATGPLATWLRHALRYSDIDEHLPRLAAAARLPQVRALAYHSLILGKASWIAGYEYAWIDKVYNSRRKLPILETRRIQSTLPAADLIRAAVYDTSAYVRRVAADALITTGLQLPDEAQLIAHLAKDRNSRVRSRADYLLRHPPSGSSA